MFTGGLAPAGVVNLTVQGIASSAYYYAVMDTYVEHIPTKCIVTNDILRYVDEEAEITFGAGYDMDSITSYSDAVILGPELMETYGLSYGDKFYMMTTADYAALSFNLGDAYKQSSHTGPEPNSIPALCELFPEIYTAALTEFTVAGSIATVSGIFDNMIFTPGLKDNNSGFGTMLPTDYAEAVLADFRDVEEFRALGERMQGASSRIIFILNTEKLEAPLNTLNLLEKLYPTIVAAALVIGAFLCCLVLLQSSKEVSIMRVLGTTKGRTITIMSLEQIFLCIIGIILGLAGLVVYNRGDIIPVMGQLCVFAGAYLIVIIITSIVTASFIIKKDLLTLLQTKE